MLYIPFSWMYQARTGIDFCALNDPPIATTLAVVRKGQWNLEEAATDAATAKRAAKD